VLKQAQLLAVVTHRMAFSTWHWMLCSACATSSSMGSACMLITPPPPLIYYTLCWIPHCYYTHVADCCWCCVCLGPLSCRLLFPQEGRLSSSSWLAASVDLLSDAARWAGLQL
jgi:hypothetical protein